MNLIEHHLLLGLFGLGNLEIALFAGVMLLLFGSAKLPQLMRNMGRSVNEFKAGIKEKPQDVPDSIEDASESAVDSAKSDVQSEINA